MGAGSGCGLGGWSRDLRMTGQEGVLVLARALDGKYRWRPLRALLYEKRRGHDTLGSRCVWKKRLSREFVMLTTSLDIRRYYFLRPSKELACTACVCSSRAS